MAKYLTVPAGVERRVQAPGDWYGIGVGPASRHGTMLADGLPIGPGSPVIFDGRPRTVLVELVSYYNAPGQVVLAESPEEVAALCQPRPPLEMRYEAANETGNTVLRVPFHGRSRLAVGLYWDGAASAISVTTRLAFYGRELANRDSLAALNTYTETTFVKDSFNVIHETERADELVVTVQLAGSNTRSIWAIAYDEGT